MDRAIDHSRRFFRSLFADPPDASLHELPNCGIYALHEAYQQPGKRRKAACSHDLKQICNDQTLLDNYIFSLSSYCKHAGGSPNKGSLNGESDYERSLRILESVCPKVEEAHRELKKRQTVVVTTPTPTATATATATATVAPATSTATTPAQTQPASSSTAPGATPTVQPSASATVISSVGSNPSNSNPQSAGGTTTTGPAKGSVAPNSPTSSTQISTSTPPKTSVSVSVATSNVIPPQGFAVQSAAAPNPVVSLPSSTYSGQGLLTSTCSVAQYTAIALKDGSYNVAPIVGCAEANPQCCPSLTRPADAPKPTAMPSFIPLSEANSALVSALNAAPLTLCPADYSSISGNCCPFGFKLYDQEILNQTPCFSLLPATLEVPEAVSQEILALSKAIAATATAANPTVSVHIITDRVFALSLPVKEVVPSKSGLSLGAKIGIGVGAGLGALIALILLLWFCVYVKRGKRHQHVRTTSNQSDITEWAAGTGTATAMSQRQSVGGSTAVSGAVSPAWSPNQPHVSYTDNDHPAGDDAWNASKQNYFRAPPPRHPLEPTGQPTVPIQDQRPAAQHRYSELAGGEVGRPYEAGGRQLLPHEAQQYATGDTAHPYEAGGRQLLPHEVQQHGAYYPAPNHPLELGDGAPSPRPRWME